ncbi:MAG: enoyl-CoA hydratase [Bryobacterales bacterium]|nr:enoyl-CoA hydratase [Bryobacterales bacterium]
MRLEHLLLEPDDGGAAIITLNRPERRNALSLALMQELRATLTRLSQDASVRTVVLASAGKVFSSGHDLTELVDRPRADYEALFAECTALMQTIQAIPQPVIAEVRGLATAAGCQLVATCDLALGDESACFATPGVRIGLFCSTPMVAVTRAIGRKRALEMLLTGRTVDAITAEEWGLLNRAVPAADLREATLAMAGAIAAASPMTVATGKRAFYEQIDMAQPDAYAAMGGVMARNAEAEDAQEGIAAFLGKRAPVWRGR